MEWLDATVLLSIYLRGELILIDTKVPLTKCPLADVPGFAQLSSQLQSGEQLPERGLLATLNSRELGELRSIVYSSLTLASHCLS